MSVMLDEIKQGSQSIISTMASIGDSARIAYDAITGSDYVIITGSGTSYHSGLPLQITLMRHQIPAVPVKAPDFINYVPSEFSRKVTAIVISQSGESSDALSAMEISRKAGARIIGITNEAKSTLALRSDVPMITAAGHEEALAATKSYVSQLTAGILLQGIVKATDFKGILKQVSRWYSDVCTDTVTYEKMGRGLKNKIVLLGNGFLYTTALEGALKFKETCNLLTEAYQLREYLHGPIQTLDGDTTVFILKREGEDYSRVEGDVKKYAGQVITIGTSLGNDVVVKEVPDEVSPVVYILPIQLMANFKAISMGMDPDKPEKLTKVVK